MYRPIALLLALLFAGSTVGTEWLLCGAPARSAAASHACCADMQMRVTTQEAAGCCTLSQQTRERAPVEPRIVPVPILVLPWPVLATMVSASAPARAHAPSSSPHPPSIPIYLQQRTLLI